jgi:hypothetical protein
MTISLPGYEAGLNASGRLNPYHRHAKGQEASAEIPV